MRNAKLRSTVSGKGSSSGAGLKTVLIANHGVDSGKWQHKISAEDLAGGGEVAFILAHAGEGVEHSVCIPSVDELPELKNVNELKFYIYSGFGLAKFSNYFDGVDLGTVLYGGGGISGAGCLIARKHDLFNDDWIITYELSESSGDAILKGWTQASPDQSINLLDSLEGGLDGVVVEIRNLKITEGSCLGTLRMSRNGKDFGGVSETSVLGCLDSNQTNEVYKNNELRPWFGRFTHISGGNIGKAFFNLYELKICLAKSIRYGSLPIGWGSATIDGYTVSGKLMDGMGLLTSRGLARFEGVYTTSVDSPIAEPCSELWLDFDSLTNAEFEYRIVRIRN